VGSLIPDSLEDLANVEAMILSKDELTALASATATPFEKILRDHSVGPLRRRFSTVLQINIGLYCNQACKHCHVESSPLKKQEQMDTPAMLRCVEILKNSPSVDTVDITGGAPELNKLFRDFVQRVRRVRPDVRIIDRCNLTVLREPGQEDLPTFLAANRVDVIASLPCYSAKNVDAQRGRKVFERSIEGLRILNEQGYGKQRSGKTLDLVYNPADAFLPPPQAKLETKYKHELHQTHGIEFSNLITITNMPIKRFFQHLRKTGGLEGYMNLLERNFNPETVTKGLMCHNTVSVNWEGKLFDCDFNQQLEIQLRRKGELLDVWKISSVDDLKDVPILTRAHCYGCTAGQGSG